LTYLKTVPEETPCQTNPFASLSGIYEAARDASQAMSPEERAQDWLHNKPSMSGSDSQRKPDTYVSPVSGRLVQI
jgi:hypothetical protein